MACNPGKHPVSDTAALVMLWASEYYRAEPLVHRYLGCLDLSSGTSIFEKYNRICPWYREVIINRKHFIRSTAKALAGRVKDRVTIVNLGAGFSPLALELSDLITSERRFIEIDENGMDIKRRLYHELIPERSEYIASIEGDVTDTSFLEDAVLRKDPAYLIVIMEGLSYYISRGKMEGMIATLSELAAGQAIMLEHLKPCTQVREERRYIPHAIFSDVRDYTGLDRMTTYEESQIRTMFSAGFSCGYYNMDRMEKRRTGTTRYFPTPDSGWLSCAVAVRRG